MTTTPLNVHHPRIITTTTTTLASTTMPGPHHPQTNNNSTAPYYNLYRGGFSTSICDFFSEPSRKSDCCSFACFGLLQSDKNEYLLTHKKKDRWSKRLIINVGLPMGYLFLTTQGGVLSKYILPFFGTNDNDNDNDKETAVDEWWAWLTRCGFLLLVIGLLVRARHERSKLRRMVLEQIHKQKYGLEEEEEEEERRTTDGEEDLLLTTTTTTLPTSEVATAHVSLESYLHFHEDDISRAHSTCWCFPIDEVSPQHTHEHTRSSSNDCCGTLWNTVASMFCGYCCGCWFTCCGMCAIGQEDRELQSILPQEMQMVDYVTFEEYQNYRGKILDLRTTQDKRFLSHCKAISQLSRQLLSMFGLVLVFYTVAAACHIYDDFRLTNMLVVLATFLQAFIFLYFIYWRWNRFDLSFDAVVKYFSSGFILCTGLSLVYEMMLNLAIRALNTALLLISVVEELFKEEAAAAAASSSGEQQPPTNYDVTQRLETLFSENHPWLVAFSVFLQAFIVAATVEELAKYFTFWMVEHPDFLDDDPNNTNDDDDDEKVVVSTPPNDDNDDASSLPTTGQYGSMATTTAPNHQNHDKDSDNPNNAHGGGIIPKNTNTRQLVSLGCGITIAMVATALGFACCENLVYVFLYTDSHRQGISVQISTLFARSLFPVHPLAAAIQSIGVCSRELEGSDNNNNKNNDDRAATTTTTVGLGRIVFPAIVLHGSFDFVLMLWSSSIMTTQHPAEEESNTANNDHSDGGVQDQGVDENNGEDLQQQGDQLTPVMLSTACMFLGILYYVVKARAQRSRLVDLDESRRQQQQQQKSEPPAVV